MFSIFTIGVPISITMVAGTAEPLGVGRHALGVVAGRHRDHAALALVEDSACRRFNAPRSLKVAVNCKFSNLRNRRQPQISPRVRLSRCAGDHDLVADHGRGTRARRQGSRREYRKAAASGFALDRSGNGEAWPVSAPKTTALSRGQRRFLRLERSGRLDLHRI